MSLQDRISHAAAVTKWKVDQQARLLRVQNQIRDLQGQIQVRKAVLADTAFQLYGEGRLGIAELDEICLAIAELRQQQNEKQMEEQAVKAEQAPTLESVAAVTAVAANQTPSGLVCPECQRPLIGRYCPDHGLEGVRPQPQQIEVVAVSEPEPFEESSPGQLVCPKCRRPLSVRFCPDHGVEGVYQSGTAR